MSFFHEILSNIIVFFLMLAPGLLISLLAQKTISSKTEAFLAGHTIWIFIVLTSLQSSLVLNLKPDVALTTLKVLAWASLPAWVPWSIDLTRTLLRKPLNDRLELKNLLFKIPYISTCIFVITAVFTVFFLHNWDYITVYLRVAKMLAYERNLLTPEVINLYLTTNTGLSAFLESLGASYRLLALYVFVLIAFGLYTLYKMFFVNSSATFRDVCSLATLSTPAMIISLTYENMYLESFALASLVLLLIYVYKFILQPSLLHYAMLSLAAVISTFSKGITLPITVAILFITYVYILSASRVVGRRLEKLLLCFSIAIFPLMYSLIRTLAEYMVNPDLLSSLIASGLTRWLPISTLAALLMYLCLYPTKLSNRLQNNLSHSLPLYIAVSTGIALPSLIFYIHNLIKFNAISFEFNISYAEIAGKYCWNLFIRGEELKNLPSWEMLHFHKLVLDPNYFLFDLPIFALAAILFVGKRIESRVLRLRLKIPYKTYYEDLLPPCYSLAYLITLSAQFNNNLSWWDYRRALPLVVLYPLLLIKILKIFFRDSDRDSQEMLVLSSNVYASLRLIGTSHLLQLSGMFNKGDVLKSFYENDNVVIGIGILASSVVALISAITKVAGKQAKTIFGSIWLFSGVIAITASTMVLINAATLTYPVTMSLKDGISPDDFSFYSYVLEGFPRTYFSAYYDGYKTIRALNLSGSCRGIITVGFPFSHISEKILVGDWPPTIVYFARYEGVEDLAIIAASLLQRGYDCLMIPRDNHPERVFVDRMTLYISKVRLFRLVGSELLEEVTTSEFYKVLRIKTTVEASHALIGSVDLSHRHHSFDVKYHSERL
ncbi:MAG: hypothetical protein QXU44_07030 [Candidatus Caldarchaeum sp.]